MKCIKWKDREGAANVPFAFPFDMVTLKAGLWTINSWLFCPLCGHVELTPRAASGHIIGRDAEGVAHARDDGRGRVRRRAGLDEIKRRVLAPEGGVRSWTPPPDSRRTHTNLRIR